jgi:uncharacterized Zn finger protein
MQTSRTWWGQRFIAALETFTDTARLARGRGYAHGNRIKSWTLTDHEVRAKIRGNINPYYGVTKEPTYQTSITLKPIAARHWAKLINDLGRRAAFVSRLLLGEMPDNIETPFAALKQHLLPQGRKDVTTSCSCPDWANPCKHVAGLYYFLAARLDRDPFLLFELRGLSREELQRELGHTRLGAILAKALQEDEGSLEPVSSFFERPQPPGSPAVTEVAPLDYWYASKRLPDVLDHGEQPIVPALLIKKGGDFPAFWPKSHSFTSTMEMVYGQIRKGKKAW